MKNQKYSVGVDLRSPGIRVVSESDLNRNDRRSLERLGDHGSDLSRGLYDYVATRQDQETDNDSR